MGRRDPSPADSGRFELELSTPGEAIRADLNLADTSVLIDRLRYAGMATERASAWKRGEGKE